MRDWLASLGERRRRVEVDDPSVTTDLDAPADVIALTGAAPVFAP